MKTYHCSSIPKTHRGFSLVEILVVIVIISVLAAVAYPVAGKVIKSGNIEKNRAIVKALDSAISKFYADYNYLPSEVTTDKKLSNQETIELLRELAGQKKAFNTKGKNYLVGIPMAKNKVNGLSFGVGDKIDGLYSSFGGDIFMILDADYDGKIRHSANTGGVIKDIRERKALVWTLGEEEGDEAANVYSWK